MDLLYNFPSHYKFQLGSSYIQIRGGKRRAPTQAELKQLGKISNRNMQQSRKEQEGDQGQTEGRGEAESDMQYEEFEGVLAPHPWLGKE